MSRIVFMGTPEFALPCLEALVQAGHQIPLVVTQPDRPAGRGQKLTAPPVKELAQKHGIKVIQPSSLKKESAAVDQIREANPDFLVVVAFGQILPDSVLSIPKIAPLNVHASLLPAYRGAAPIARSIMEGDETTGVTIQWMVSELDMGDILFQLPCSIQDSDTAQTLHDNLKILGAQALITTLDLFSKDQIQRKPQDVRVAPMPQSLINPMHQFRFNQPAFDVHRQIMGLNPWPVAQCFLHGQVLRIHKSRLVNQSTMAEPGTLVETSNGEMIVACIHSCIALTEVQPPNKRKMSSADFLRGHPLPPGLILGSQS